MRERVIASMFSYREYSTRQVYSETVFASANEDAAPKKKHRNPVQKKKKKKDNAVGGGGGGNCSWRHRGRAGAGCWD